MQRNVLHVSGDYMREGKAYYERRRSHFYVKYLCAKEVINFFFILHLSSLFLYLPLFLFLIYIFKHAHLTVVETSTVIVVIVFVTAVLV